MFFKSFCAIFTTACLLACPNLLAQETRKEIIFIGENIDDQLTLRTNKFLDILEKKMGKKIVRKYEAWKRILAMVEKGTDIDIFGFDLCIEVPPAFEFFPGYSKLVYKTDATCIPMPSFDLITSRKDLIDFDMPITDKKHFFHLDKYKNLRIKSGQSTNEFVAQAGGFSVKRITPMVHLPSLAKSLVENRNDAIVAQTGAVYFTLEELYTANKFDREYYYRPLDIGMPMSVITPLNKKSPHFAEMKKALDQITKEEFREIFLEFFLIDELRDKKSGSLNALIKSVRDEAKKARANK